MPTANSLVLLPSLHFFDSSFSIGASFSKHALASKNSQAAEAEHTDAAARISVPLMPSIDCSNSTAVAVARSLADVPGSVVAVAPDKWYSPSKKYYVSLQTDAHLLVYTIGPPETPIWGTFIFYPDNTAAVKLLLMVSLIDRSCLCVPLQAFALCVCVFD